MFFVVCHIVIRILLILLSVFFYFALSHNIDQRLSKNSSNHYEQSNSKMTKSNLMPFCLSKSCISSTLHLRISHGSIVLFRKATSLNGIPTRFKVTSLNGIPTRCKATNLFLFQSQMHRYPVKGDCDHSVYVDQSSIDNLGLTERLLYYIFFLIGFKIWHICCKYVLIDDHR